MAISPLVLLLLAFLQCTHTQQRHRVIGFQSNSGQSARHKWPANYRQKPGFTGEIHFLISPYESLSFLLFSFIIEPTVFLKLGHISKLTKCSSHRLTSISFVLSGQFSPRFIRYFVEFCYGRYLHTFLTVP